MGLYESAEDARANFLHGIGEDSAQSITSTGGTAPPVVTTPSAPAAFTNAEFFTIGEGTTAPGTGPVRRGLVLKNGGAGPVTAFAWETRDNDGNRTDRWVECRNVFNADPRHSNNVWVPFLFRPIREDEYGSHPTFNTQRELDAYLLALVGTPTPPVIGGLNPVEGPVGTPVLINGNNFGTTAGQVKFGTVAATVTGWANNQIRATVPAGAVTGKVRVITSGGEDVTLSDFTVTAAVVVRVPGPISDLSAVAGNGQVVLQWAAPTDNGGAPILDYEIKYRAQGATAYTTFPHSPRVTPNITVGGLANSTQYQFTVAPVNRIGTGPASAPLTATTTAPVVVTPTVYNATAQSYTTTAQDWASKCGSGTSGTPVTRTSSNGSSTVSQDAADAQALADAKAQAVAAIVCAVPTTSSPTGLPAQNAGTRGKVLKSDGSNGSEFWGEDEKGAAAQTAGVTSFNNRTGAVGLQVSDLADLLVGGTNVTIGLSGGKLVINATATTSGTGTGSGTANYPAQSPATNNKFLKSTGTAGGEAWDTPTNNRVGFNWAFKNQLEETQDFFRETTVTRIAKTAALASVSYAVNGGAAVALTFTGNVFTPPSGSPLVFPVGASVVWAVTYAGSNTRGSFEIEAVETI